MRNVFLALGLASVLVLAACGKKDEAAPAAEVTPAEAAPAMEEAAPVEAAPAEAAPAMEEAAPAEAAPAQ